MNNKLVLCIVLFGTILVSGCINSSIDNINEIMLEISNGIVEGDNYYNESVSAINSKHFDDADRKANLAIKKFTKSKKNILETNKYYEGVNQTIYIEYLNLLEDEIDLKNNASSNLLLASQEYENKDIQAGNSYSQIANSKMNEAVEIQNQRNNIVEDNPDLFKEFFYF
ncbi:MAG: hypothetical protein KO202_05930 [Methanobacteriaceae archaeon]|jgi:hypothetical protein|nr:hypothetical protein [Methanobacteriaceae archaeon]